MILPLFPLYVELLHGGGLEVGLLMAAFMVTRAFLARPFGKLSDRVGRKVVIVTGMFLYAVLAFLFTLPTQWWGLFLVRVLQGTASAMVWPVGEALVVDSAPPSRRSRAISIYMLSTNFGTVAGPLLGGLILYLAQDVYDLGKLASYRTPFYFTSGISLVGALLGLFLLRNMLPVGGERKELIRKEEEAHARIGKRVKRSLRFLYANSFIEGFSYSMVGVVMVFYMTRNFGLGARDFSILVGVAQGLALLVILPTGVLSDRFSRKPLIVTGNLGAAVFTFMLSIAALLPFGRALAVGTYTTREMGIQMAGPAMRTLQADLSPARIRGKLIGTLHQFSNLGSVIGPVLGGLLWDLFGHSSWTLPYLTLHGDMLPFLISAFVSSAAALMVLRFVHEPRRRKVTEQTLPDTEPINN